MLVIRRLTEGEKRSVRHWAMEFVVVVAGVLLALWLQDWWERRRARSELAAAEEAIHDEVLTALKALNWRRAISKCHTERLALVKSMLLNDDDHWPGIKADALTIRSRVPESVFPGIFSRPVDSLTTAAWSSALTSGALAPMDRDRLAKLVRIYDQIEAWRHARDDENEAVAVLAPLSFPITLTPELRAQFLDSLYRLDRARFAFAFPSAPELAAAMRELGWDDTEQMDRAIREDVAETNSLGFVWRSCVAKPQNPFRERPFAPL